MGLQLHPESNVTQNLHPFSPCIGHKIARYSSAKDPARAVLEAQATRARGRAYVRFTVQYYVRHKSRVWTPVAACVHLGHRYQTTCMQAGKGPPQRVAVRSSTRSAHLGSQIPDCNTACMEHAGTGKG